jgi:hypothetical protein
MKGHHYLINYATAPSIFQTNYSVNVCKVLATVPAN